MVMVNSNSDSSPRRRWTTQQVRDLIDESRHWPRYELIDGELIVTPGPEIPHQLAVMEMCRAIMDYTVSQEIGIAIVSPSELELQAGTLAQPDVFVVPANVFQDLDRELSWTDVRSLSLAIEIISPASVQVDRVIKRDFYMNAGVDEYWIVDLDARMIEKWIPSRETPEVVRQSLEWRPTGASSSLTIDLVQLFERIRTEYRSLRAS